MPSQDEMRSGAAQPVVDQKYVLTFDLGALVRLSLGTALLVSTVLLIPDTIAILPSTHDFLALVIRASGLWLTVFIQWSLAFLGILHVAGMINRGISLEPDGIKLSRFSKRVDWSDIAGVGGDARPLISKLMFLKRPATRLQLYVRERGKVKTRQVDSLCFAPDQFDALVNIICKSSFGFAPNAPQVVIANEVAEEAIKGAYKKSDRKSKLITAYIAIMLVLFTGRGAARNYFYNEAGQSFNKADYKSGKHLCELSLAIDGTYPYALDRLARCEFRMQDSENAEKHWLKALQMKPDMVSAKVGLSNVLMKRGDFEGAKKLLTNALRLEPRDIPTVLNVAFLNVKTGNTVEGMKYFERAMQLAPGNPTVRLLCAEAYLNAGDVEKCRKLIEGMKIEDVELHNRAIYEKIQKQMVVAQTKGAQK